LDLEGALAVPGLIEGHAHYLSIGRAKVQLDLRSVAGFDEIVAMVEQAVAEAEPGQWIFGRGWHQEKWQQTPEPNVSGLPYHDALSAVSPDNPVYLTHASGHAAMVNSRALEMADIDRSTPDPPGGEIVRDRRGRAIGVLRETAENLVGEQMDDEFDPALVRRMAELAAEECLSKGITSFQDAGVSLRQVEVLRAMATAGELPVRLWMMFGQDNETLAEALPGLRVYREGDDVLTVGGIKRYADGALGSHGAWLLEPYSDMPSSVGLNIDTPEVLREAARLAAEHGLQQRHQGGGVKPFAIREVICSLFQAFGIDSRRAAGFFGQQLAGGGQAGRQVIFGGFLHGAGDHLEDIDHMVAVVLVIFIGLIEGSLVLDHGFRDSRKQLNEIYVTAHFCSLILIENDKCLIWGESSVPGRF
jgi:hypothetical protein